MVIDRVGGNGAKAGSNPATLLRTTRPFSGTSYGSLISLVFREAKSTLSEPSGFIVVRGEARKRLTKRLPKGPRRQSLKENERAKERATHICVDWVSYALLHRSRSGYITPRPQCRRQEADSQYDAETGEPLVV